MSICLQYDSSFMKRQSASFVACSFVSSHPKFLSLPHSKGLFHISTALEDSLVAKWFPTSATQVLFEFFFVQGILQLGCPL